MTMQRQAAVVLLVLLLCLHGMLAGDVLPVVIGAHLYLCASVGTNALDACLSLPKCLSACQLMCCASVSPWHSCA
jgi:ABC-type antimicrobial peptide transport system permease subunit